MVNELNIKLILEIILVFATIMFIHELGHFLFAKKAGIFVREFSLGLGPKLFSFEKGETQYSLRIIPFGAYVRMAGEDPEVTDISSGQTLGLKRNAQGMITDIFLDKANSYEKVKVDEIDLEHKLYIKATDDQGNEVKYSASRNTIIHYDSKKKIKIAPWDRQFGSKSLKDRFATIFAGPMFNIIMAILLFFTTIIMYGVPTDKIMISEINKNSPAEIAGLQTGDILLGIGKENAKSYEEILKAIQDSPGKALPLKIQRDNTEKVVNVTPSDTEGKGLIGVQVEQLRKKVSLAKSAYLSLDNTANMAILIIDGFGKLVTGQLSMNDLTGPVGIISFTSEQAKRGLFNLLNWTALLNLYIGILNLLPFPALDGSRLMFLTLEGLRGKPVDPQKESMVHFIGFAFLMLLMIVVTVNDVSKFFVR